MNARKVTIILVSALGALGIGLIVGTYLLAGTFKKQSTDLALAKANVEQLTDREAGIAKSKRDIVTYTELGQITKTIVPQDKDQAATVREIVRLAGASGVPLTTITFPSSTLGTTPTTGAKATPNAAASAAAAAKPNLSQLTPVVGLPGVYNLQITLGNNTSNTVSYNQLVTFLRNLENNRRTAAVSSINIQPQPTNPDRLTFTLIINTYIKP